MDYRFTSLGIMLGIIIFGHILKRLDSNKLGERVKFTADYHKTFIELVNVLFSTRQIDSVLYGKCIHDVDRIQTELGDEGLLAEILDPLRGIHSRNYPLLLNTLPQLRSMVSMLDNSIMVERLNEQIRLCDDALRRHIGILENAIESELTGWLNPFSCFEKGINYIVGLPLEVLYWCGILSLHNNRTIHGNIIFKGISKIVTLLGLIGSVITIGLGWTDFSSLWRSFLLNK